MLRRTIRRGAVLACLMAAAAAAPARAQEPESTPADEARGRELYENGALLYEEGRYEDAILAWEEGWRLTGRSGFLYNIANAQERLGRYEDAIDALGRYRAFARAEEREILDRRIRNLEDRLAEARSHAPPPAPLPAPVPASDRGRRTGRTVAGAALVAAGAAGLAVGAGYGIRAQLAGRQARTVCVPGDGGPLCPDTAGPALQVTRRSAVVADLGLLGGTLAAAGGAVVLLTGGGAASDAGLPLAVTVSGRFR